MSSIATDDGKRGPGDPSVEAVAVSCLMSASHRLQTWLDSRLGALSPRGVITAGILFVLFLALVHYSIGYEVSFAVFYTAPIAMVAWYGGRRQAFIVSVLSATSWHVANRLAGETFSSPAIPYWNAATRLGFFLIISVLLTSLKQTLQREQGMSRTDVLTGLGNRRAFMELAQSELQRAARRRLPFTLVYLDLDNFKAVNDRQGHEAGDQLLRIVADVLRETLRKVDHLARLGGDEFAILMVDADEAVARSVLERTRIALRAAMQVKGWPVTFSIGVLVCPKPPASVAEMIRLADDLMYSAKLGGKDRISLKVHDG